MIANLRQATARILMRAAHWIAGTHVYLSTSCHHGEHAYCQSHTGLSGAKRAGFCKFCDARCTCRCHRVTP